MSKPKIYSENEALIVELPLTTPTGRVRVKNKDGLPKAPKQESFKQDDYVEWQISYASENPPEESKVDCIKINETTGFELTKLLCEGIKGKILSDEDIEELEKFILSVQSKETLEENQSIFREKTPEDIKGFKKSWEKVPVFIKENKEKGYFVEIILKHKQRAVGLQAMVYLCIGIDKLKGNNGSELIGRKAKVNEFGKLVINEDNKDMIKDVVKAFAIASNNHKRDINKILELVKEKCK